MLSLKKSPKRFFVLIGGILNFVGLGYYYTVGPFLPTITIYLIKQNLGVESINTKWFPTLTLVTSAVAMPAAGALERRNIFKATLFLSAMFCSLGILLSHLSVKSGYACFMLTYCVMYGIGFGLNYSTTPFVVLEWYPNNQCLACGSVFFGLGVGWILFSQIQTYIVKSQKCDFVFINGTNCEAPDKVPSVFMINGSIIFAVQMLGTVLMKKRESNEFHHEDYHSSEEASLETDTSTCPDVNPRDLVHYRGFYILWMLQLIECFPTMIFLTFYKVGKSRVHKLLCGIFKTANCLMGTNSVQWWTPHIPLINGSLSISRRLLFIK